GQLDGISYLALEFIEGRPLSKLIRDGDVTQSQAVKYLIGILKALDYAEGLRLIHRDIKPDNIMINEKKIAKLLDMGLTKEVGDTSMTKAGQILGTPDYISPEQARGDMNLDIRADIYSLGATFYHVFTGQKPFPGGGSLLVLLNQHISAPLTPLQQIKPLLDKNICAIIERMMAKDRNDRYLHPKDIIQEIESLIQGTKQGSDLNSPASSPALTPVPLSPQELNSVGTARTVIPGKGRNPNAPVRPSTLETQNTGTTVSFVPKKVTEVQSTPLLVTKSEADSVVKEAHSKTQKPSKIAEELSLPAKSVGFKSTPNAPFKTPLENKKGAPFENQNASSLFPKLFLILILIAIVVAILFFVFYYNKPK
ncbi:MAG: serine/threonine-protein kinase, partial [Planctomycetota bacterium]